ncbi:MAG: hypothetical protein ETSY2_36740 [Candidatus Entotheonella gemina]|uniref:NAD(P)-binding domain-containing protein n=1 Tax=Candidatus Entotheonella gemina TaxID=1429439 RepID=W4LUK0_9BACT|nr:MAG: hypothetical protein ETSY2_36740 [Candidatus Entotheonella gemina]
MSAYANAFGGVFNGLTILVTGHTGFKGAWLSIWLRELGAKVIGYALAPPTTPNHFEIARLADHIKTVHGDILDAEHLKQTIETYQPTVIFHLAAQSNVLHSFRRPVETFTTNVIGTINVLEAVRSTDSVRTVVGITSDKCYANQEWLWGYRENDRLGGHEPYSASKAMAELAIESYRDSFFARDQDDLHGVGIASTRAGNVIGGGDFADFRLVPDCMKALMAGHPIEVRNPHSVRPWQLVLEPLSGYLWLAVKLLQTAPEFAGPWNFGPLEQQGVTAGAIVEKAIECWGAGTWYHPQVEEPQRETALLRLSWDKAANRLGWRPTYTWEEAIAATVGWFKYYQAQHDAAIGHGTSDNIDMYSFCVEQICAYTQRAKALQIAWSVS